MKGINWTTGRGVGVRETSCPIRSTQRKSSACRFKAGWFPTNRFEQCISFKLLGFRRAQLSCSLPVWACSHLHTPASWVIFGLTCSSRLQGKRTGMYANDQADLCRKQYQACAPRFPGGKNNGVSISLPLWVTSSCLGI